MVSAGYVISTAASNNSWGLEQNATLGEQEQVQEYRRFKVEEILVVLVVVVFWVVAFLTFLRKWDSIRIMQPMEPRYRHSPKNLENIKIVKRPQDSIIYKNYSRKMSTTMVAREKRRLMRMHTVPCMGAISGFPKQTITALSIAEASTDV